MERYGSLDFRVRDFELCSHYIILLDQAYRLICRKRPIKVVYTVHAREIGNLALIHWSPDIDSRTNARAAIEANGEIRCSRYSPEFAVNTAYQITYAGAATETGLA